jgi:hypothetical protein
MEREMPLQYIYRHEVEIIYCKFLQSQHYIFSTAKNLRKSIALSFKRKGEAAAPSGGAFK